MRSLLLLSILFLIVLSCKRRPFRNPDLIDPSGSTVQWRIKPPVGYERVSDSLNDFGTYLRRLRLKPDSALVRYYDGSVKVNRNVYVAVADMPIGKKNLHQCADAVMHLRACYLRERGEEDKIHFTFTNGFRADYSKWKEGYRVQVNGNKTSWMKTAVASSDSAVFWQYLEIVFAYCGTLSLSRELVHVNYKEMMPGDVLIKGGTPGHAEIVLDMVQNKDGKKLYLLAQSAMPAQELQVLANPMDASISPWYELDVNKTLIETPEDNFTTVHLMRFANE